jgi:hypothetical protein
MVTFVGAMVVSVGANLVFAQLSHNICRANTRFAPTKMKLFRGNNNTPCRTVKLAFIGGHHAAWCPPINATFAGMTKISGNGKRAKAGAI